MKSLRYLMGLFLLLAVAGLRGSALGDGTVLVTNNTSYTLQALYASPSDAGDWDLSVNLLSGTTVAAGQTATVTIADGSGKCVYDLMAILYGVAQYTYQYQVNVCGGGSWNISDGP